jgi:hypothetical protein
MRNEQADESQAEGNKYMSVNEHLACPEEVKEVVLDILHIAVLSIRIAGWNGDADYCALEADHIHNLPGLLKNYSVEKLRYYLEAERPDYLRNLQKLQGKSIRPYEDH